MDVGHDFCDPDLRLNYIWPVPVQIPCFLLSAEPLTVRPPLWALFTQSIFGLGFLESFPPLPHFNKLDRSFLLNSLATPFIACDHITGRVDVGGTYQMCSSPSSTCLDLSKLLDLSTPDFFFFLYVT